jgi:hypothetical protein
MKLLIMRYSPTSRHVSLRSKYSPQHPVVEHPKSILFPLYEIPSLILT